MLPGVVDYLVRAKKEGRQPSEAERVQNSSIYATAGTPSSSMVMGC